MKFRVEVSRNLDDLLKQETLWDALSRGVPFRESSWLGPWWQNFGDQKEPFVLLAKDEAGAIRGILPLYRQQSDSTHRALWMIGDGQACSDYTSILARSEDSIEVAESIGAFLVESDTGGDWDTIHFDGVVEGDAPMAALMSVIKDNGGSIHAQSRMSAWYKPVDESWADHLKHFGKTQRRKMRRWSEKVDATEGLQRHTAKSPTEVETDLHCLIELHQRRWEDAGEPGSFADPWFRNFIQQATVSFAAKDQLYLPTLSLHDRTIGAELHFVGGDQNLYCYSSGYDLSASDLEPGRILCTETLMHLYESGLAGIDYLRGDEPYKKRMAALPRRVYQIRLAAPSFLPKLRHAAWRTGFEFKQWVRRQTGRKEVETIEASWPSSTSCDRQDDSEAVLKTQS